MDDARIASCAVELRPKSEQGAAQSGGLSGRHHFSFAAYQRWDRLEWGALRALNIYMLEPGAVRAPTFHADFEIVTVVTGGCLLRTGTFAPIQPLRAGAVELVSAGTGANLGLAATGGEPATYIEIWVRSNAPTRRARRISLPRCPIGPGHPLASGPVAASGALELRAAARLHRIMFKSSETLERALKDDACLYALLLEGQVAGNDIQAGKDDALAASGPGMLTLRAERAGDILLIETTKRRKVA